jgi:hypothetical protein
MERFLSLNRVMQAAGTEQRWALRDGRGRTITNYPSHLLRGHLPLTH